uniref:G-protein coupled receptors family 1 profile domain-containing protein n=1 Tax=Ditylenchus dipsaci TaxID=166011 RepID=A0A915E7C1_9BILA
MRRLVSIPWSTSFGSLFVLLTTIGLIGNTIVIIAIAGDKKMRKSVMNMLLLNLAVADALNLITTTVEWTHTIVLGYPAWVFPSMLCPLARYLECVFLFTSILTQLTVCVERYIAIVYPIHARRLCSRANILLIICTIWSFVFILALPYALFHEKRQSSRVCGNPYSTTNFWMTYKWVEFFSFFFVPCIILCYSILKFPVFSGPKTSSYMKNTHSPPAN